MTMEQAPRESGGHQATPTAILVVEASASHPSASLRRLLSQALDHAGQDPTRIYSVDGCLLHDLGEAIGRVAPQLLLIDADTISSQGRESVAAALALHKKQLDIPIIVGAAEEGVGRFVDLLPGADDYLRIPGNDATAVRLVADFLKYKMRTLWMERAQRHNEAALRYRLEVERLITALSTDFVSTPPEESEGCVRRALAQLGELMGLARCYVVLQHGGRIERTFEWCANETVAPRIATLEGQDAEEVSLWAVRNLRRPGFPHTLLVAELPDEARTERELLMAEGTELVIGVPLVFGGRILGLIGGDSLLAERPWIEEDVRMLRLAGELIEGALERRRALAELREVVREQVQQEDRIQSMSEMARSVVHDFRNLLTLISGSSDVLLLRPDYLADKERVRRGLTQIKKAVGDLDNMLRRLRQFYRPRTEGELFTAINLSELVRGVLPAIEVQLQGRLQVSNVCVALRAEMAPDLPLIQGNGTELREVITNLLLNAADAVVEKGMGSGTLIIRTSHERDFVVLEVEDDGCGMKAEVLQRCLEPNFTTKGSRGMGLGLALVVGVLQRHLGHIEVHSERGHGTTFRLHFPRVAQIPLGEGRRPLTILVVEDDSLVRNLLLDFLTDNGHHVQLASGGYRALQTFQGNWFDLVVVDQRLSDELDGERLGTMIKEIAPQKPVILIADDEPGDVPAGVDRVLTKPFDLASLNDMIHDLTLPDFGAS